jgi:signal peptidase I
MRPTTFNRVLGILASIVLVGLTIAFVVVRPIRFYVNKTGSMRPTWPVGCRLVVRTTKDVHVGDLIAFRYPLDPSVVYAKRIVGGPDDRVEIKDKQLIVNGRAVNEPYVIHEDPYIFPRQPVLPEPYRSRDQFGPVQLPADSWFVLGDNRDRSTDSRYWGTVPAENVVGRVIYVIK